MRLSICAALLAAGPSWAQVKAPAAEERLMMAKFADCAIAAEPRRAEAVVLDGLEAAESLDRNPTVVVGDCLPVDNQEVVTLSMRPTLIRYALAESLLRRAPMPGLGDPQSIAPLEHGVARGEGVESKRANIAISRFGECVVRVAPEQSASLLQTPIGSDAESAASEALKPAVSSCLMAGQTVVLPIELLRGTIALNYYRLAMAPRLTAGGAAQ